MLLLSSYDLIQYYNTPFSFSLYKHTVRIYKYIDPYLQQPHTLAGISKVDNLGNIFWKKVHTTWDSVWGEEECIKSKRSRSNFRAESAHLTPCESKENGPSPHESLEEFRSQKWGEAKQIVHFFQQEVLYHYFKVATEVDWIQVHGKLEGQSE